MTTTRFARRVALFGTAGAILVSLAAGPVFAGHGYMYTKEAPIRGDFPAATGQPASAAPADGGGPRTVTRRDKVTKAGDWLRGDFPRAVASDPTQRKGGVAQQAALQIPDSAKLRIEQLTVPPGAALAPSTMKTAVICEMVQGELAAVIDGTLITLKEGDVWACPEEQVSALHTNTGTTRAVMRLFHLVR